MTQTPRFNIERSDGSEYQAYTSYTPLELQWFERQIGYPGTAPFTRGIHPLMYRSKLWTMRQYAGFGTAEESNQRYKSLLESGQTGLSIAFDLPTQMGYDADDTMARGEIGRVGVSISTLADMERVLQDLPLGKISTSMTINSTAGILLAFYIVAAEKKGVELAQLRGTVQNDILKEYIARGTYIYPPKASIRFITDIIEYCAKHVPSWNPISISGYHIREAGSDAVQELAYTFSNAIAYCKSCLTRGLTFDEFAPQLSFFFASHSGFLEEIAKFRAARRLWHRIGTELFHSTNDKSLMLRFHVQTGGSTLTAQQPDNNIVRTTYQAMAAILGGCQSLHTNSKDEALSLPTESSALLALRTQQLLAEESGITSTVDPCAGSFTIEQETQRLFELAWSEIERIQQRGGSELCIEKNCFQHAIAERAYEYQKSIEENKRGIVGVNRHVTQREIVPQILKLNENLERDRIAQITAYKKQRNQDAVKKSLTDLITTAKSANQNLMFPILEAVRNQVTLGEISHALRSVFGIYQPNS